MTEPGEGKRPVFAGLAEGAMVSHYRVGHSVGKGGMGAVYRAYDTQLCRSVALKVLLQEYTSNSEWQCRFLQEARSAAVLNHPNIVSIYEVGSDSGLAFIAMELIDGTPLNRIIPALGMPLPQALDYAASIADGLATAHSCGVIHRDLKPGNIMVTRDGRLKLLDFGLAKRLAVAQSKDTTLTMKGEILGTPAYMSPEQAQGKGLDARSDIFSFGCVLYEMLTGRQAFTGASTIEIMGSVMRDEPAPLSGMPPELEKMVSRCLRKDPARRTQNMGDVKLVLEDLRQEGSASAHSAPSRRECSAAFHIRAARILKAYQ